MLASLLSKTEVFKGYWPFDSMHILFRNNQAIGFVTNDISPILEKNVDLWVCKCKWNERWFSLPALASVASINNEGFELREVY